ncbi:MAG TPA: sugar ABC transporter permease [Acholeplasmataceae bacterium]|jgi:ABC-type sugar transport system permease subunit|nr:sugar ABC transporter permease [Acholeplasmataceae bacterium]
MKKIKEFFNKIGTAISKGVRFVFSAIGQGWDKLWRTKPMAKVKEGLLYVPRKLTENLNFRQRKALWGVVFIVPLIIGFIYFFFLPFIVSIIYCFSYVGNAGTKTGTGEHIGIITEWVGLDNFRYIFLEHTTFRQTLLNSTLNTLLTFVLVLVFSLIIAVLLNSKFRGRAFVRAVFFMPVIFNSQAVDVAMSIDAATLDATMDATMQDVFSRMFNFSDFLINANLPSFAVSFLSTAADQIYDIISYSGVQILIFLAGIQSVPKHLYEAAKIEGATQYDIFWKITFPMVSPLMLTAGVYTIVDSFLRSDLLSTINVFKRAGTRAMANGLGELSTYGIHAAMSLMFALTSILLIAIVLFLLSRLVFYYDE